MYIDPFSNPGIAWLNYQMILYHAADIDLHRRCNPENMSRFRFVLFVLSWWRHQMETFSALLALCAGNSPVTGEFPSNKGQWRGALMFSWIWAWTNGWVNNRHAGDLRHHRAHYDVTIMIVTVPSWSSEALRRQKTMLVICSQCFWKGCICFISVYFHFFFSTQV